MPKIFHHSIPKKPNSTRINHIRILKATFITQEKALQILRSQQVNFSSKSRRHVYINTEQENGPGQYACCHTKFELDILLASCERDGRDMSDYRAGKSCTDMTAPEPLYRIFPEPHIACSQADKTLLKPS